MIYQTLYVLSCLVLFCSFKNLKSITSINFPELELDLGEDKFSCSSYYSFDIIEFQILNSDNIRKSRIRCHESFANYKGKSKHSSKYQLCSAMKVPVA